MAATTRDRGVVAAQRALLAAVRRAGKQLVADLGDLRPFRAGASTTLLDTFTAGADAEAWQRVFEHATWIAEDDDGCVIGVWSDDDRHAIVHLDTEGTFTLVGATVIDYLAWRDGDHAHAKALAELASRVGSDPPRDDAARRAVVRGMRTPDELFARAPAVAGPRPLCSRAVSTRLGDGRIFVYAPEDLGSGSIVRGTVHTFDGAAFTAHSPIPAERGSAYAANLLLPGTDGSLLMFAPAVLWHEGEVTPIDGLPAIELGTVAHRVRDGSWLVYGGRNETRVYRYWISPQGPRIKVFGELPQPRSWDAMVELAPGQLLFGAGESRVDPSGLSTMLCEVETATFRPGPPLPRGFAIARGSLYPAGDGRALAVCWRSPETLVCDGTSWSAGRRMPALAATSSRQLLDEGTVVGIVDGDVVIADPRAGTERTAGKIAANSSGARAFLVAGGRILFVGGTAFANVDAEPELFDPASGTSAAITGYEKQLRAQQKGVERERRRAKSSRQRPSGQ
jgi:hypothetical protein